jgi:hypothetical protein
MVTNDQKDDELFISEVRKTFFNLLKPLLICVDNFIDKTKDKNNSDTVFTKYFDKDKYMKYF